MPSANESLDPDNAGDVVALDDPNGSLVRAMESASETDNAEETVAPDKGEADAATTEQPVTPQSATVPPKGDAPESRIQAAVRNARAEARAEVERQYAPFKGMDPEQVQVALSIVDALREDPQAFVREVVGRLGMALAEGDKQPSQTAAVSSEFKLPAADIVSADGKLRTFSEAAVAGIIKDLTNHVLAQVDGRLKPVQSFVQTEEQTRQQAREQEARRQAIVDAVEEVKELPHFDQKGVLDTLKAMDPAERQRLGPIASLRKAYKSYVNETVLPNLNNSAEQRVREQAQRKAATSAGNVRPGQGADKSQKPRLDTVDDLAAHMQRLASSVEA